MDAALDRRIANMEEYIALPRQNGELVFEAPWEARAFGMAVALSDSGLYEWRDFSQSLAAETAAADRHGLSVSCYEHWLTALEKLATARGLITPAELEARTAAYTAGGHDDAPHAAPTPHDIHEVC